ncbi:hypothetical protein MNAN1_002877 [Malassezia nana]|uniref:Uncharacterized protein n=1 Tax=Malassezia nana TaxID=180528 RepID=A0AAF0ENG8_9BASI|nr:hypothetical protein MNAN1_002877 [Malassezia nana]
MVPESGAISRSQSLPSSITTTPELDQSSFLSEDSGASVPMHLATDRAVQTQAAHAWSLRGHGMTLLHEDMLPYMNITSPPIPFVEALEGKALPLSGPNLPSWLSPVSLSPCESPSTQDDHTPPPKRQRVEKPEHAASRTETIRAWLVARRAQLQQAQDQIREAQSSLKARQAHWDHVQSLLRARIAELRQRSTRPPSLGLLESDELDDPLWDAAPMSSVAELLEQNILCL